MFMLDYNETFKKSYTRIERCKIKKYNSMIRNEIKTLKRNSFASFKSLHNQLKPLHGHPNNKHLLADLETQMSELIECQKDNIIHMLVPHKVTHNFKEIFFSLFHEDIKAKLHYISPNLFTFIRAYFSQITGNLFRKERTLLNYFKQH